MTSNVQRYDIGGVLRIRLPSHAIRNSLACHRDFRLRDLLQCILVDGRNGEGHDDIIREIRISSEHQLFLCGYTCKNLVAHTADRPFSQKGRNRLIKHLSPVVRQTQPLQSGPHTVNIQGSGAAICL